MFIDGGGMISRIIVLLLLLIVVPAFADAQKAPVEKAGAQFINYKYEGVVPPNRLPNGVKHLGGGLIGDFDADPVYGISRVTKGTTTMLWLEVSTGRDESGVTGWRVLDVLSFPALRPTQHLAFALDPAIECTRDGKGLTEDTVIIGDLLGKSGIYKPQRAWIANLRTGKFESAAIARLKCLYSEP
jgi:hypothetical protein